MQQTIAVERQATPSQTFHIVMDRHQRVAPHRSVEAISTLIKNRHLNMLELGTGRKTCEQPFVSASLLKHAGHRNVVAINFRHRAMSCLDLLPRDTK